MEVLFVKLNPIALRTAKILWNFGCFESSTVKVSGYISIFFCHISMGYFSAIFPWEIALVFVCLPPGRAPFIRSTLKGKSKFFPLDPFLTGNP